ncbi:MAG: IS630 family transposase [Duodenibacillus sp.]|nr:IS630 family transposase [Duodenibacillus sp.]
MKATDARRHTPDQLKLLRVRAFAMRREGFPVPSICKALGVGRSTVFKWFKIAKSTSEEEAINGGKRGRPQGVGAKLTRQQEAQVRQWLIDKNPRQMKFDFAMWTRRAVRALIKRMFKVDLSISAVGVYLRSWGFTSQRPMRRAIEQNSEAVLKWKQEQYPDIARRAKAENAIIYWSDETAVKHDTNWVTGFAPAGKTPVLQCHDGRWKTATMVSAISNQGLLRFKIQDKPMNQETFVEFLENLIEDEPRKIYLIVDNLRVHKSKAVTQWVEAHKDRIELFFLPPYSPELNPDEYVNRAVKTDIRSRAPAKIESLKQRVNAFMKKMSKRVHWIAKIFENPHVQYAAAGVH